MLHDPNTHIGWGTAGQNGSWTVLHDFSIGVSLEATIYRTEVLADNTHIGWRGRRTKRFGLIL